MRPLVFLSASLALLLFGNACSDDEQETPGPRSYEKNVVPILVNNCSLQACHGSKESNLGIYLPGDSKVMYEELQKSSPSFGNGALKFVVPGDPAKSFLMRKMDGDHGTAFTECKNGCGKEMPPEKILDRGRRETIRLWIKEGAKNN